MADIEKTAHEIADKLDKGDEAGARQKLQESAQDFPKGSDSRKALFKKNRST